MRAAWAVATAAALTPGPALAHAFAQRYDLPLPLWHYLAGAGAAVALSFVVVALAGERPAFTRSVVLGTLPAPVSATLARMAGVVSASAFVVLMAVGLFADQGDWDSNLLPVTVWVLWWVGLTFAAAAVGPVWRLLDPWRAMAAWWPARPPLLRAARGVACWPAVALFLAFAWAELVWTDNAMPRRLATVVLAYSLLAWSLMALAGAAAWRRSFDPFDRYFGLLARFAPLSWRRDARGTVVRLRWPGAGLGQGRVANTAEAAFVIAVIATVSFDGFSETPAWEALVGEAMGRLYATGFVHRFGYGAAGTLVKTAGLLAAPVLLGSLFVAACAVTGRIAAEATGRVVRRFVPSLVPIAVAYHLAHYLSYLLVQGQVALPLLSDPLALGWDLFGTRGREVDIAVIDMRTVWLVAVGAIVAGHVIAVALAHGTAKRAYGALATRSQGPLLVLMIAYTMLSLWILAQPIVTV